MKELNIKAVLAIYIVALGLYALIFIQMKETTSNSIVNLILLVIGYYFGSSHGSAAKDKLLAEKEN